MESIVVTEGTDSGVVLLSDDGPTDWSEKHQVHVYRHEHFSPLGDALIALHGTLAESPAAENTNQLHAAHMAAHMESESEFYLRHAEKYRNHAASAPWWDYRTRWKSIGAAKTLETLAECNRQALESYHRKRSGSTSSPKPDEEP